MEPSAGPGAPLFGNCGGDGKIERELRVNEQIRVREVRLIAEDGSQLGIVPAREALRIAREQDLDLIEVAPQAQPPVCRIMDYGKHKYAVGRRDRQARKKQTPTEVRLLRLKPQIGDHDLQIKVRKLRELLEEGNKVRLNLRFRGAWIRHPELGQRLFDRICQEVSDIAHPEGVARLEGRMMNLLLAGKPGVKPAPKKPAAPSAKEPEKPEKPPVAVAQTEEPKVEVVSEHVKQEQVPQQVRQDADTEDSGEAG